VSLFHLSVGVIELLAQSATSKANKIHSKICPQLRACYHLLLGLDFSLTQLLLPLVEQFLLESGSLDGLFVHDLGQVGNHFLLSLGFEPLLLNNFHSLHLLAQGVGFGVLLLLNQLFKDLLVVKILGGMFMLGGKFGVHLFSLLTQLGGLLLLHDLQVGAAALGQLLLVRVPAALELLHVVFSLLHQFRHFRILLSE